MDEQPSSEVRLNDIMRAFFFAVPILLCVGCANPRAPFVQDGIRIVPPVARESDERSKTLVMTAFNDGGTKLIKITDADGKKFDIYFDHRIGSSTPGRIYLFAYPGEPGSVLVVDQRAFRKRIGVTE